MREEMSGSARLPVVPTPETACHSGYRQPEGSRAWKGQVATSPQTQCVMRTVTPLLVGLTDQTVARTSDPALTGEQSISGDA